MDELRARLKYLPRNAANGKLDAAMAWAKYGGEDRYGAPREALTRWQRSNSTSAAVERSHMDGDAYKAVCGYQEPHSGKLCSGQLGFLLQYQAGRPQVTEADAGENVPMLTGEQPPRRGDWYIYHLEALEPAADGGYQIVRTKRRGVRGHKLGRRPLPDVFNGLSDPRRIDPARRDIKRGIVGRLPVVPAVIVCPICNRRNRIDRPDSYPKPAGMWYDAPNRI